MVHSRWIEPANWEITKEVFFKDLPPIIKSLVPNLAQQLNNIVAYRDRVRDRYYPT